jgi:hypothetical protein
VEAGDPAMMHAQGYPHRLFRFLFGLRHFFVIALGMCLLSACTGEKPLQTQQFVGTWKSSRLASRPVYLMANGEWEIRDANGGKPLQYGVWRLQGQTMLWTYLMDGAPMHDRNLVVSIQASRFTLREQDGSLTEFEKIE